VVALSRRPREEVEYMVFEEEDWEEWEEEDEEEEDW